MLSKTRYKQISDLVMNIVQNDKTIADAFMVQFCQIMNYDPTASTYTPERKEAKKRYLEKKKQQGISTYVADGHKSVYWKKKAQDSSS